MSYSFYDWNNALQQRNEYVEDRLKDGSPIIAVGCDEGVLMLTLRTAQRKIFEVYDRLMMGALGKQSDVEAIRLAAIDSAHREGFERSPDDVSLQRMVGFGLSPAVKKIYNDQQTIPLTVRAVFAELGLKPGHDQIFVLGYDGEFKTLTDAAVAAGTSYAEDQALDTLKAAMPTTLADALTVAITAWGVGRTRLAPKSEKRDPDEEETEGGDALKVADDPAVAVREALKNGAVVEAGLLQRNTTRETKFRLLTEGELEAALSGYRS